MTAANTLGGVGISAFGSVDSFSIDTGGRGLCWVLSAWLYRSYWAVV